MNPNHCLLRPLIIKRTSEIVAQKIDVLVDLWQNLFESEIGQEHLKKLTEHVDDFFSDIISETESRKKAIKERIDSM